MSTIGTETKTGSGAAALIITALEGIEATAAAVAGRLGLMLEIASSRAAALRLMNRRAYAVVVLDQILVDADPEGADLVWKYAALAIPLQFSFALAGSVRLEREIRAALARREREEHLARVAVTAALDTELKNAVTGFLLESRLALDEEGVPPKIESRLRTMAGIADQMRERLVSGESNNTVVPLHAAGK